MINCLTERLWVASLIMLIGNSDDPVQAISLSVHTTQDQEKHAHTLSKCVFHTYHMKDPTDPTQFHREVRSTSICSYSFFLLFEIIFPHSSTVRCRYGPTRQDTGGQMSGWREEREEGRGRQRGGGTRLEIQREEEVEEKGGAQCATIQENESNAHCLENYLQFNTKTNAAYNPDLKKKCFCWTFMRRFIFERLWCANYWNSLVSSSKMCF